LGVLQATNLIILTSSTYWALQIAAIPSADNPIPWLAPLNQTGLIGGLWVAVYFLARKVNQVLEQKDAMLSAHYVQLQEKDKVILAATERMITALTLQVETNHQQVEMSKQLQSMVKDSINSKEHLAQAIDLSSEKIQSSLDTLARRFGEEEYARKRKE